MAGMLAALRRNQPFRAWCSAEANLCDFELLWALQIDSRVDVGDAAQTSRTWCSAEANSHGMWVLLIHFGIGIGGLRGYFVITPASH